MSRKQDRFKERAKFLTASDLAEIKKETPRRARGSAYRAFLDDFLSQPKPALQLVHITGGEMAGFLGLIYPPMSKETAQKEGKEYRPAPYEGKITIQTRTENPDRAKGEKALYTVILTKAKKG